MCCVRLTLHQVSAGEVVDVVLKVLVAGGLLDSKVLSLDEAVQEVVLLTVLLLLVDGHHGALGVLSLAPGRQAELSLDAQLGRLRLVLLGAGRLGTYWGGAGRVS